MTERTLPGIGLSGFWDLGATYKTGMDENLRKLSALTQLSVKDRDVALPGTPSAGDIYIVDSGDATNPNQVAVWDGPSGSEAWVYIQPQEGWLAYVQDENAYYQFDGSNWVILQTGGGGGLTSPGADFRGFRATLSGIFGTAIDTPETVPFDAEEVDTDNGYSSVSFVFTAPATLDGAYVAFSAGIRYDALIEGFLSIRRSTDGGTTWADIASAANKSGSISANSGAIQVSSGDQFRVELETTVSAGVTATPDSYFSGAVLLVPGISQSEITAAYSVTDADLNGTGLLRANFSSGDTITVPSGLTRKQPLTVIQTGAGQVSFAAGAGVTIHSLDGKLNTVGQYASATLIPDAETADTYYLIGGLAA